MHAIHPHIPGPLLAALGALVLTVLVVLALASSTGDVHVSLGDRTRPEAPMSQPVTAVQRSDQTQRPAWLSNPLASPLDGLATPVAQH
jgi:hypothetical protein